MQGDIPGQVDMFGGRQVHWVRQAGSFPAVLLLGGCGVGFYAWDDVVELLPEVDVVRMDRPGMAGTPWPRLLPQLGDEVATLVDLVRSVGAPLVVVGHSLAGPHAEALTRLHPELVSGLVLVDSSIERNLRRTRAQTAWLRLAKTIHALSAASPVRLGASMADRVIVAAQSNQRRLVDHRADLAKIIYSCRETGATVVAERAAYAQQLIDLELVRDRAEMPAIPVTVLTAAGDGGQQWVGDQSWLAQMLGGAQVVLDDSRHLIMLDRPDIVAQAIRSVRDQAVTAEGGTS